MSFCSGVEDSLIISIVMSLTMKELLSFEILDERLVKYNNELQKKNSKNIKK